MDGIRFQMTIGKNDAIMRIFYFNRLIGHIAWGMGCYKSNAFPIGYSIDESFRRKGIMKEALRLYLEQCGLNSLQASIMSTNLASIRLVERAGFTKIYEYNGFGGTVFVFEKNLTLSKTG